VLPRQPRKLYRVVPQCPKLTALDRLMQVVLTNQVSHGNRPEHQTAAFRIESQKACRVASD